MRIFIALGAVYNSGPLIVNTEERTLGWSVVWLNKMSNAVTKLTKLDKDEYIIENTTPRTPTVSYEHRSIKEACLTFFINTDIQRVNDEIIKKAREDCANFIKKIEKLATLNINIKDANRVRQRKALNTPVFIGKNKEAKGILLGLDWAATKAKVALLNADGNPSRVVELPTTLVWIP